MVCLREPSQQGFWGTFTGKHSRGKLPLQDAPIFWPKLKIRTWNYAFVKENPKNNPTETAVACENNKGMNLNDPAFILRWFYTYLFFKKASS
jgi:hypothetical protein